MEFNANKCEVLTVTNKLPPKCKKLDLLYNPRPTSDLHHMIGRAILYQNAVILNRIVYIVYDFTLYRLNILVYLQEIRAYVKELCFLII